MTKEAFLKKNSKKERLTEPRDQEISDKFKSLGINFENSINSDGALVYTFFNAQKLDQAVFLLDADNKNIIYQALHFEGNKFEEPGSKKEITPDELVQYLLNKFPEADNVILSCCHPDRARSLFKHMDDKIIFIGTGFGTYSTWYSSKTHELSSVKNNK